MTNIEESESEFDLEHHGILGMKWGRRKSTSRGGKSAKRRKNRLFSFFSKKASRKASKSKQLKSKDESTETSESKPKSLNDHQRYLELSHKKISQMSTNEINEWVNRTNAIQNYKRLTAQQAEENLSTGRKVMNFFFDAGKEAAKDFARQEIKNLITSGLSSALKGSKSNASATSNALYQQVLKRARHARH